MEQGRLIFKCRVGSHLYGLNRPESDEDFLGVFIPRSDYLLGLKRIEEVDNSTKNSAAGHRNSSEDVDDKNYALPQYLHLLLQNNPNIVEELYATPENILINSSEWIELVENRDRIISQKVYRTFKGYAFSQKKKLTVKSERYHSLADVVEWIKLCFTNEELNRDDVAITEEQATALNSQVKYYKSLRYNCESFHKGMSIKMIFEHLKEEYENYGWRVHTDTFDTLGYDCYSEDTEFLTESGWKKYNEILDEKLATINTKSLNLEFQNFSDKKILPYSGKMYNVENMFSKCSITPNHKMFVSACHRGLFGYKYVSEKSDWQLTSVEDLNKKLNNRTWFHILNSANNTQIDYNISDNYLKLAGAYLSEGTLIKKYNKIKSARMGQTTRGKKDFFEMMSSINEEIPLRVYKNSRISTTKNKVKIDYTWWYTTKDMAERLYGDFGSMSESKKLPSWILKLSKRQALVILNSAILGDGTERKFCYCYNTISIELASGIQTLAFLAGKDTNLKYFSYIRADREIKKYHIYISKDDAKPKAIFFNTKTNRKWKFRRKNKSDRGIAGGKLIQYNGNVCCFTTPNSTLVTRLDGKIAIQGNCKFGYHLIRILAEAYELLLTGKLTYPISGEIREDIIRVREGQVELKELLSLYEKYEKLCDEALTKTTLIKKPEFDWADAWLIRILKKSILEETKQ